MSSNGEVAVIVLCRDCSRFVKKGKALNKICFCVNLKIAIGLFYAFDVYIAQKRGGVMNLSELLSRTQHSVHLTAEEYCCWRQFLPSLAGFLERTATQGLNVLVGEILADCIDLAVIEHQRQREEAMCSLNEALPSSKTLILAPDPVRLVGYVFAMAMNFHSRHRTLWAMLHAAVERLVNVNINAVQFYPMPHGLIVCRRHAGSHQLRNLAAIGNCLIGDDTREGVASNVNLSVVATRITVENALMSLLESWRLRHGRARKYLCDVAQGFENQSENNCISK